MRVLIINRWDDEFSDYGAHIDHHEHSVAYVTVPGHLPRVPAEARSVEVVAPGADDEELLAAARRCRGALGGVDRVLALSEFNLLLGGRIRDEFGVPGPGVADLLRFRDKPLMKETVARAGLRVPRLEVVDSAGAVARFAATVAGATVLKPRTGAAAAGVRVIPSGADPAPYLEGADFADLHAEEFVTGTLWHVDGLMRAGAPWFACASRYLGTPLGFASGQPTASVCDDGPDGRRILDFALRCLDALGLADGAFHLEAIDAPDGPVFLEVGARVGGCLIPWTLAEVHGFDLVREWIRLQMGQEPAAPGGPAVGGALLVPGTVGARVRRVEDLSGRIPGLYAQVSAEVGKVLEGEDLVAGFRFRGTDTDAVLEGMARALREFVFELDAAPVEAVEAERVGAVRVIAEALEAAAGHADARP
ncbi:biotin carboxylase [Catenulispora subtropica]|uniref:ATP-grasp domain-containing protein n=1 Tax=Catenulispora subtropica TaxID=450798 RepID=A0ABN2R6M1_9ACTN